ncbi:Septin-domain-containing protein [Phascolomyces articulosus]|uniref:Septin-domain-containing protein n=1 Tax=Phascolomyces articulosus TaxID=60185 RepID=A0AAD5P6V9_9FUNG|nr:Septin-domain-containing protein [Phascolomyces articulosus]
MLYNAYSQRLSGQQTARSRKESVPHLNVMVVGKAGAGKTMFVRTLCERLKCNIIQGTFKESKSMALKEQLRATEDFYSVSMYVEENGERISFTLIDTPGFDDGLAIDHQLNFVAKYIDYQFELTLIEETKVKRDTKAFDTHIHACLYFMDTTSNCLSDTDRYALRVLSSRVNVIPVIGKADTLTVTQRESLKRGFRNDIFDALQIPIYGYIEMNEDDEKDEKSSEAPERGSFTMTHILHMLRECISDNDDDDDDDDCDGDARTMVDYLEQMPYTVFSYEEDPDTGRPLTILRDSLFPQQQMSSQQQQDTEPHELTSSEPASDTLSATPQQPHKKYNNKRNTSKNMLGRRYPWAVIECCNPDHCDFEKLRTMIVTSHRDMLRIDTFERFYEKYRTEQLLKRRVNKLMATTTKCDKVLV